MLIDVVYNIEEIASDQNYAELLLGDQERSC